MRKYLYTGLVCTLLSAGLHLYLSKRSYELKAGSAGESQICSISEKINCDSALLSPYGEVFGISLSNFGFAVNLALAFVLLCVFLQWLGGIFWKNLAIYTAGFIALVSLGLTALSLQQELYCPLCWATYILSYIGFFAIYGAFREDQKNQLKPVFLIEAFKNKLSWIFVGAILGTAFFLHMAFITGLGLKDIEDSVNTSLIDWRREQVSHFSAPALFNFGPTEAKMNLVEFADFLCPHCKRVHPQIKQFLKNHPQVSFSFYSYPLDSQCNKKISFSNGGLSCDLTKLSLCGIQQKPNGEIIDRIFEKQQELLRSSGNTEKIQKIKEQIIMEAQLEKEALLKCLESNETETLINKQIAEGVKAQIPGTPSVFVNGKLLRGNHLLQTLQTLYKELQ